MRLPLLVLFCALALAACGGRQQPPPWMRSAEKPRDENYHGGNAAMLLKYDANHDGTLTRDLDYVAIKASAHRCLSLRHYAGTESGGAAGVCFGSARIGTYEKATKTLTIIRRK